MLSDPWIFALVGATALTYGGVEVVRHWALRRSLLCLPTERSSHFHPVPFGGGLVLVGVNLVAWALVVAIRPTDLLLRETVTFIAGGLLIAGVSWIDDLGHVPYQIRLAFHLCAASLVLYGFSYFHVLTLPLFGTVDIGYLGIPLTLLWIVGLINAFNFMDGIDGTAAGQAAVGGLGWVAVALFAGQPVVATLGGVLAASALGFLRHNWYPARIFMGDTGSTFLGYTLAVLPVMAARENPKFALVGLLIVWPAVFDSTFTVLYRLWHHQSVLSAHRSFLFLRLVDAGWSHVSTALLYSLLPLAGIAVSFIWLRTTDPIAAALGVLAVLILCVALWLIVMWQERRLAARSGRRSPASVVPFVRRQPGGSHEPEGDSGHDSRVVAQVD